MLVWEWNYGSRGTLFYQRFLISISNFTQRADAECLSLYWSTGQGSSRVIPGSLLESHRDHQAYRYGQYHEYKGSKCWDNQSPGTRVLCRINHGFTAPYTVSSYLCPQIRRGHPVRQVQENPIGLGVRRIQGNRRHLGSWRTHDRCDHVWSEIKGKKTPIHRPSKRGLDLIQATLRMYSFLD